MAIELYQTAKTITTFTFQVTGIPSDKDRKAYIWIATLNDWSSAITYAYGAKITYGGYIYVSIQNGNYSRNPASQTSWWHEMPDQYTYNDIMPFNWVDLTAAVSQGYIYYVTSEGGDNGTVRVELYANTTTEGKVWEVCVASVLGGVVYEISSYLCNVLKFEWKNTTLKVIGNDLDIAIDDFTNLNWFACYMYAYIGNTSNNWYFSYDAIHANEFVAIAQKIYDTAYVTSSSNFVISTNRADIMASMTFIINNVITGELCKAIYFNLIKASINNFNLKV